eukprot:gene1026-biopygen3226
MSGAGGARAWRGHGAGMSCSPRSLRAHHTHGEARRGVAQLRGVGKARHGAAQRNTEQCGAAQWRSAAQRGAARRGAEQFQDKVANLGRKCSQQQQFSDYSISRAINN